MRAEIASSAVRGTIAYSEIDKLQRKTSSKDGAYSASSAAAPTSAVAAGAEAAKAAVKQGGDETAALLQKKVLSCIHII